MSDLSNVDFSNAKISSFEPVPEGEYTAYIESDEIKAAASGNGDYLQFIWVISEGPYKNKKIFSRYNLWNSNQQAVQISVDEIHTLCMAVLGIPGKTLGQTEKLFFKPCSITVQIERNNKGGFNNVIKGYKPITPEAVAAMNAARGAAPAPAVAHAPQPAPATHTAPQVAAPAANAANLYPGAPAPAPNPPPAQPAYQPAAVAAASAPTAPRQAPWGK